MSRAVKAGQAYVELGVRNRVDRGLKAAEKQFRQFGRRMTTMGAGMVGAAVGALTGPVMAASQAEETFSKFNTVFGESANEMRTWSDATAAAMGVSQTAMAGMLSGLQDLLVPMGVMPDEAAGMSQELSKLAIDLGSFNNMRTEDTMRDLMAALTGSGEVMKKYGVLVDEAAVKQELLNQAIDPKEATNAQKAQARMQIIMRGTTAAQGDAIRTADGFANSMKRLWAQLTDVAVAIGSPLLEPLATALQGFTSIAARVKDFATENQALVKLVGMAVVGIGALGAGLLTAGGVMLGISAAIGGIATVLGLLLTPIGAVVAAVVGLGAYFAYELQKTGDLLNWLKGTWEWFAGGVIDLSNQIIAAFQSGGLAEVWEVITTNIAIAWKDLTDNIFNWWDGVMNAIVQVGVAAFNQIIKKILEFVAMIQVASVAVGKGELGRQLAVGVGSALKEMTADVNEFGVIFSETTRERIKARDEELAQLKRTRDEFKRFKAEGMAAVETPAAAALGAGGGAGGAGSVRGTFSAAGAMLLGLGAANPMERTAKATEASADKLDNIDKNLKQQKAVFS